MAGYMGRRYGSEWAIEYQAECGSVDDISNRYMSNMIKLCYRKYLQHILIPLLFGSHLIQSNLFQLNLDITKDLVSWHYSGTASAGSQTLQLQEIRDGVTEFDVESDAIERRALASCTR